MKNQIRRCSSRIFICFLALSCVMRLCTFSSSGEKSGVSVHRSGRSDEMTIALTFDDGPHPKYTDKILSILEKYHIHATFFVVGENVEHYPEVTKRVIEAGHELGNHTYSHADLSKISYREGCEEIMSAENAIFEENEYSTRLLRPPGGLYNDTIFKIADRLGYSVILWTVDTRDWAHNSVDNIVKKVLSETKNGDIILFHDYISKKSPTPEALEKIIPLLIEKGFKFVTVTELLGSAESQAVFTVYLHLTLL